MTDPAAPAHTNSAQDENEDPTPANPTPGDPNAPALNQPAPSNPAGPPLPIPNQPVPNQPAQMQPALAASQIIHQQVLNWSHFKPEFAGRQEEDVETHLLYTNDWMITRNFPQAVKMQRFCLTLTGDARLWYESLTPIANDLPALQEKFRRQYSKIGNMQEQLFHGWRSFHYDKNRETVDAYVNRIRQVVVMLGNGEPQILEVFKSSIPNRLYWILLPIDSLRVAVETAKRVLTKGKIDRQMSGQSSTTPFMKASSENNYSSMKSCKKGVTFDAIETIERNREDNY